MIQRKCVCMGPSSQLTAVTGTGRSRAQQRGGSLLQSAVQGQGGPAAPLGSKPTCCPCLLSRCSLSKHRDAQPRLPAVGQHCRTTHHLVATPGVNLEPHVCLNCVGAARSLLHVINAGMVKEVEEYRRSTALGGVSIRRMPSASPGLGQ